MEEVGQSFAAWPFSLHLKQIVSAVRSAIRFCRRCSESGREARQAFGDWAGVLLEGGLRSTGGERGGEIPESLVWDWGFPFPLAAAFFAFSLSNFLCAFVFDFFGFSSDSSTTPASLFCFLLFGDSAPTSSFGVLLKPASTKVLFLPKFVIRVIVEVVDEDEQIKF